MKEIGIGMIGTGMMGKTHSYAYRNLSLFYHNLLFRTRLVGVCSGQLANAQQMRDDLGYEFATDDYRDILNCPDITAINICTPNHLHYGMLLEAIRAGKHIYCDKPLTVTAAESEAVLDALQASAGNDLVNQVAFHIRFFPAVIRARQLIQEGRIGRILCFRATFLHSGSVDPNKRIGWKQDVAYGGGVLMDLGSHVLDLVYDLLGEFRKVMVRTNIVYSQRPGPDGVPVDIQAEDSVLMLAEMKNGGQGTIEATKVATGAEDELRIEIHGDRGALRFSLMDTNWLEFFDNTIPEQPYGGNRGYTRIACVGRYEQPSSGFPSVKSNIGWLRGHVHCLYSFLDCVASGRPASPSFADGAYIQVIMEKARQSDQLGQWVDC